jgi:hypothetical protein
MARDRGTEVLVDEPVPALEAEVVHEVPQQRLVVAERGVTAGPAHQPVEFERRVPGDRGAGGSTYLRAWSGGSSGAVRASFHARTWRRRSRSRVDFEESVSRIRSAIALRAESSSGLADAASDRSLVMRLASRIEPQAIFCEPASRVSRISDIL